MEVDGRHSLFFTFWRAVDIELEFEIAASSEGDILLGRYAIPRRLRGSNAQRDLFLVRLADIAASSGDLSTLSDVLSFRRHLKSQDRFELTLQASLKHASTAIRYTA